MYFQMQILSPPEYGLPEKFDTFRPVQKEALEMMLTSTKRAVVTCIPAGGGKSLTYMAAAVISKIPTCIVTHSRGLQSQLLDDFSKCGLVDIRGRRNYACDLKPDYTCEEGFAARCPYKNTVGCPASQAEMKAAVSPLVVTNYSKWTHARKFGTGMSHFQQVIFDESHEAVGAVAQAMQVILNHKEIEEGLKVNFPLQSEAWSMDVWKTWATEHKPIAEAAMQTAYTRVTNSHDPKPAWVKHYMHMRNLARRITTLATCRASDWVADESETGYQFDPIRVGKYAESTLLLRIPKIIAVSATVRPKTMFLLGMGKDSFDFREFDSDFDPARCPIYYIPTMRVDRHNPDLRMLWIKHDQIAAKRRDRKSIVHTVSYARQNDLYETSRFSESMMINPKGEPPTEMVARFKAMSPKSGAILVSPAVGTGYDFPDDAGRYQILCKIPFEPSSKITKAREKDDPEFGAYQAMQGLVQSAGRITRSKSDWGEQFLLDSNIGWFLPRYGHLAPRSFHRFFKHTDIVPPPLNFS